MPNSLARSGKKVICRPCPASKKAVVKMLAGPYDEAAINAKLDGLIAEPVVMLSFTK